MSLTAKPGFTARYLVKRKTGMSFEAFRRHQLEVHVPLALALPGLRDYALSFFEPMDGVDQPFDALAEVTYDDAAAHQAAMDSDFGARALADLPNYMDEPVQMTVLVAQPGDSLRRP